MFEVSVTSSFSAAHHIVGYSGSCSRHHGHNWQVEVTLRGDDLNEMGILVDFRKIKKMVEESLGTLDHADLNELEFFNSNNPTSENLAKYLFDQITGSLGADGVSVARVTVSETPTSSATYWASGK